MEQSLKPGSRSKLVDSVAKLIELTQNAIIIWKPLSPGSIPPTGQDYERVEAAYEADYLNRHMRFYKRSYKSMQRRSSTTFLAPQNEFYAVRVEEVVLEHIDTLGNVLYRFPELDSLNNLFSAVQYANGGRDLIDALLQAT